MEILSESARQTRVNRVVVEALGRGGQTEHVGTTAAEFEKIGFWLRKNLRTERIGVIVDARTRPIAEASVLPIIGETGIGIEIFEVPDLDAGATPICSTDVGERCARAFRSSPDAILSVGSGTLTDIAKLASRTLDVPCIAVATAASMNGFSSSLAATLDNGVKLTVKAPTPKAVWALPSILQAAPAELTASGLGDLHSKPISSADWRLNHLLQGAPWDLPVVEMLTQVTELMRGVAAGLQRNEPSAYAQLFAGLCLTGIAMQAATPGSQASGAEHLISHYFDMIAGSGEFGHTATTHGAQVAVGCMVSLSAWRFALEAFQTGRPLGDCPSYVYDPEARDAWIRGHFKSLSPTLQAMHHKAPKREADVMQRRARLAATRGEALLDASQQLPDQAWLQNELTLAGCPFRFSSIGISRALAEDCLRFAPWVRARYTILHLLMECGWYDAFIETALDECVG